MTCALYQKNYDFIHERLNTSPYVRKGTSQKYIEFNVIMVISHLK